jgi:hypothetical protein
MYFLPRSVLCCSRKISGHPLNVFEFCKISPEFDFQGYSQAIQRDTPGFFPKYKKEALQAGDFGGDENEHERKK